MLNTQKLQSILIIEDDRIDVLNMMRSFKRNNVSNTVHLANNGESALELLLNTHWTYDDPCPNVVFLDINMPRMNGFEFLERIANIRELRHLDIYVMTSSVSHNDLDHAFDYHISGYIHKSSDSEELDQIVQSLTSFWTITHRPNITLPPPQKNFSAHNSFATIGADVNFLLVDDDQLDQNDFIRRIKKHGYLNTVYTCSNGVDALSLMQRDDWNEYNPRPNVIILDINMPLMNGHEFLHNIRNSRDLKNTTIFISTTSNDYHDIKRANEYDVAEYFIKPIDIASFTRAVNAIKRT
ncbi:MAG: response regulator [Planctomycetes bacterium]|nr:response regulator [Planctomycetota bacterium]